MTRTEYFARTEAKYVALVVLIVIFIAAFFIVDIFLIPINLILSFLISIEIPSTIFVSAVGGILISLPVIELLVTLFYDQLGWYAFELKDDSFIIIYRSHLTKSKIHLKLPLDMTIIKDIGDFIVISRNDDGDILSVILSKPEEREGENFYDDLKQRKRKTRRDRKEKFKDITFEEIEYTYMFTRDGDIRKLHQDDLKILFDIDDLTLRALMSDEPIIVETRTDYYEFNQIIKDSEKVDHLEYHPPLPNN